jgi:hypothetical protein
MRGQTPAPPLLQAASRILPLRGQQLPDFHPCRRRTFFMRLHRHLAPAHGFRGCPDLPGTRHLSSNKLASRKSSSSRQKGPRSGKHEPRLPGSPIPYFLSPIPCSRSRPRRTRLPWPPRRQGVLHLLDGIVSAVSQHFDEPLLFRGIVIRLSHRIQVVDRHPIDNPHA